MLFIGMSMSVLGTAWAAMPEADVILTQGPSAIQRNATGNWEKLQVESSGNVVNVFANDILKTGSAGSLQLKFASGKIVSLKENTRIEIEANGSWLMKRYVPKEGEFVFAEANLPPPVVETPIAATVLYVMGFVYFQQNATGNWVLLTTRPYPSLSPGDMIRTESLSKAEIQFANGNVVRLAENSRLKIQEAVLDSQQRQKTTLSLLAGKVWNQVVGQLTGGSSYYKVQTPIAVAAVKGTIFDVSFGFEKTEIRVFQGIVEAHNRLGAVDISAHSFSILNDREPPARPMALPSESDFEWNWQQPTWTPEDGKSPELAAIQSLLVPGLGEFYVEQPLKGAMVFLGEFFLINQIMEKDKQAASFRSLGNSQKADSLMEQNQLNIALTVAASLWCAWDSWQEAGNYNRTHLQQKVSWKLLPDGVAVKVDF
jgi:hypothetical protein